MEQVYFSSTFFKVRIPSNFKRILSVTLTVFAILLSADPSIAQISKSTTTLFTPLTQEGLQKAKPTNVTKFRSLQGTGLYKQITPVQIGNLAKIQKDGALSFSLPGSFEKQTFYAEKVDAESEMNFKWFGLSKDKSSSATFISVNGAVSGTFSIGKRHFQVFTIEDGFSILQEDRTDLQFNCSSEEHGFSKPDSADVKSADGGDGARMGVCTEPMRVYVAYTQAAANSVVDIAQTINLSVQQYNQTTNNSGISSPQTNNIVLAGTQLVSFAGANDPEATNNAEQAAAFVRDNGNIQNIRNQSNADLVICLVERQYDNGVIGSVTTIPANNVNYAAVVRAPFSSTNNFFTFTHELGHLVGGRHQNDPGSPAYSHGFAFTAGTSVRTVMHTFDASSQRIMHFSSPNTNFNGVPTGTANFNHAARVISETSLNVVNFRPSVTQPFNATIIGPTSITNSGWYNWELYYFCQPLGSTTWQFSTDGFNYGPIVGFGDAVNNYSITEADNGNLFLRCIINNGGQNYVTTTTINVNICWGCRTTQDNLAQNELDEQDTNIKAIFPNPASKFIDINFYLNSQSEVELQLVDLAGFNHIQRNIGSLPAGFYSQQISIESLNNGIYVCRLKGGGKVLNKQLIVLK